ncbi:MAG: Nuclear pore complex protein Nup98-Nup96 [Candelina submexicana]|nr:MAG: Nuclear pore complex protein Nup98-Nup96 [Candelina submexicana]
MSFGFGSGNAPFGSNNNQQQQGNTTFGGFGSGNTTGTGFPSSNNNAFGGGGNNAGGTLFGGGSSNAFGSGGVERSFSSWTAPNCLLALLRPSFSSSRRQSFILSTSLKHPYDHSSMAGYIPKTRSPLGLSDAESTELTSFLSTGTGSAFGTTNNQTTPFGASKPFGTNTTSSGGSLFGGQTATAGSSPSFAGFGNNNNATNTSSPFGAASTGGSLFGNNKPAFGSNTGNTSGTLFGGTNTGAFGTGNNTTTGGAFGSPASTALGGANPQSDGTGSTPFQAFTEKDVGNQTNHFQSITFMQPYQKFSFEELRAADYAQGRRYGNGSGQAGAFGTNTGFGSFGTNTTSAFGNNTTTNNNNPFGSSTVASSSPFGGGQTASTGFNTGNAGGSIFGNKPASMFGNAATSGQSSGGIFGTSGSTSFGGGTSSVFGSGNTGGNMFGNAGNTNKDNTNSAFAFGGGNTGTGGAFGNTGPFGQNTSSSGSNLFGTNTATSSPFGQQQGAATNLFGSFGQNQQPQNQTSTNAPFGSGFGNNQQSKPGGFFGNTGSSSTGASLFGNNQNTQQQTSGGIFGNTNSTQGGGSIFGNNKPAGSGTTGPLFGNIGGNTGNTGSSLFPSMTNNQNPQPSNTSIFGGQNQQPNAGNPFGGATSNNNNSGNSLFPGLQQSGGSSLFGGNNTNQQQPQQQQPGSLFGPPASFMGGSQQNPQQFQQPQAFQTSILDANPYGNHQLFQSLATPAQSVGPLATPLSSSQKLRKSAIQPHYRINPNAASRLITPQKRGYGFSYSTYGTPNSVSSNVSTPGGFSNGLFGIGYGGSFGRSLGRSLGKSFSTSNLRRNFDTDDSILSPGAFSANGARFSNSGSLKKLTIDRNIRTDLFGALDNNPIFPNTERSDQSRQSGILKKKVSFDASTIGGNGEKDPSGRSNGNTSSALVQTESESATPSAEEQGFLRSSHRTSNGGNGTSSNAAPTQSEMEQVKGNELAVVPEDDTSVTPTAPKDRGKDSRRSKLDQQPGEYYMRPSLAELKSIPRDKLKSVDGFVVGREGCGKVAFDTPVDLTTVDLDNLLGKQVVINSRSATVYPENASKPPRGKGLNVPSIITLENSWPRTKDRQNILYDKDGPRVTKHIDRLRKVAGTEFIKYDRDLGEWSFKVQHFTTYAVYDENDGENESFMQSTLSAPPDTPTPKSRSISSKGQSSLDSRNYSRDSSMLLGEGPESEFEVEDTFEFKKRKVLPGAFDKEVIHEDEPMDGVQQYDEADTQSFLDKRSVSSPYENDSDELGEFHGNDVMSEDGGSVTAGGQEMVGTFPEHDSTTGRKLETDTQFAREAVLPKSILKASQRLDHGEFGTPKTAKSMLQGEWTEQLQRTVSPKKQNRQALRESQATALLDREGDRGFTPKQAQKSRKEPGFRTSIDLMNSLFGQQPGRKAATRIGREGKGKGFEWPYDKKSYQVDDSDMIAEDKAFHETFKPSWGPESTFLYVKPTHANSKRNQLLLGSNNSLVNQKKPLVFEKKDLCFAKFPHLSDLTPDTLSLQKQSTTIKLVSGVPFASMRDDISFHIFGERVDDSEMFGTHEKHVWELASILFDDVTEDMPEGISGNRGYLESRVRKDLLSKFWGSLVQNAADKQAYQATTQEEKALAYLSGHNIEDACGALLDGRDFRLATLLSMIGGDMLMRQDITNQIKEWRRLNVLSEITEPIRALYELLAGNTCVCEGKLGPPEDRAITFTISERFNFDWKRTFGMKLWYGILEEHDIAAAVSSFAQDLQDRTERMIPIPWFVEQNIDLPCNGYGTSKREDLLWGLLKVYTDRTSGTKLAALEEVLLPQNCSGDPVNARLSFQLYHTLKARKLADFSTNNDAKTCPSQEDRADQLTWDFATQLEGQGEWMWALFVLFHLRDSEQRKLAIQGHLARHASKIGEPGSVHFRALVADLQIPEGWVWEAKALFARAVLKDHVSEVEFLLRGKHWKEAHTTLSRTVAPHAVTGEDFETLSRLLSGFEKGETLRDWTLGGQVYADYMRLIQIEAKGINDHNGSNGQDQKPKILKKLVAALPAMMKDKGEYLSFHEKVAIQEMSGVVGRAVLAGSQSVSERAKVLQLPLTEDTHLKHTIDLSVGYYRALLADGR